MATAERTIRIRFDGSSTGLASAAAKARAEIKAMQAATDKHKQSLAGFSASVLSSAASLSRMALTASSVATAVVVLHALAVGAAVAAGAFPLLVAGGLAAVGVMAAIKLGSDGIKRAFEQLTPTLNTLKSAVSLSFEQSFAPAVRNLKTLLPQLTVGLKSVASAVGGLAGRFTAMLAAPRQVSGLNTILNATTRIVQNIGKFLAPVGAAFIRIGAVAAPILVQLTSGLGNVGERFNAFIQAAANDGRLAAWIRGALDLFRQIGSVVGTVFGIVKDVITGLMSSGLGQLGGTLTVVLDTIRAFTSSADGQAAIKAIGDALAAVSAAVGKVLNSGLRALGPLIPPLADAFGKLATIVGGILATAIGWLGPKLQAIAGFIQQNSTWLVPLVVALGGLAVVIQTVITAVKIWQTVVMAYTVVQWLLNAAMDANPIGLVVIGIAALIALIVLIVSNLDFFRGIWDAVWKWASDVVTAVVIWFRQKWDAVVAWFTALWIGVRDFFKGIWQDLILAVTKAVVWIRDKWNVAVEGIKGFFRGLGDFIGGIWDGIVSGAKRAVNVAIRLVNGIIHGVNNVSGLVGIPSIPDIPMLARGGTASAGHSYLVGERGPELFTPGRTGRVTNATTTADAIGGRGGATVLHAVVDLGAGIAQRLTLEFDEFGRQTRRTALAGGGR
ncbi:hypothetical protein [Amycolatopsis sp. H20-H5]|uniref:hypothetical protein n=1 Tax=Amycolatopsis sp. H20-H5 TaxID=3046309 RepID=UPI002DBBEBE3|nr:hypothetical protein [Amycolatopsis sp. H20-H5]MEC3975084.1 hypothetical protein [Amycolatopsis sp. H20-H5]